MACSDTVVYYASSGSATQTRLIPSGANGQSGSPICTTTNVQSNCFNVYDGTDYNFVGATGNGIGSGAMNSVALLIGSIASGNYVYAQSAAMMAGYANDGTICNPPNNSTSHCWGYYLPSQYEASLVANNYSTINSKIVSNCPSANSQQIGGQMYYTSTEKTIASATSGGNSQPSYWVYSIIYYTGAVSITTKSIHLPVRAVRAF